MKLWIVYMRFSTNCLVLLFCIFRLSRYCHCYSIWIPNQCFCSQLLRKCILNMSNPTIEGPLGNPPFEKPSIAKVAIFSILSTNLMKVGFVSSSFSTNSMTYLHKSTNSHSHRPFKRLFSCKRCSHGSYQIYSIA